MARLLHTFIAIGFALAASVADASYHTFQIDEIFTNADGTVQYIVLHEAAGLTESLAPEMGIVKDVQWWRARVREARRTAATAHGNQTLAERITLP